MANTLRFKRGLVAGIPTGVAGEPLFTTDTFDLYIGNGTTNTRFQQYIASGTTLQYLRGDGSLATFPTNIVTGTGTTNYLPKFTGASTLGNSLAYENTNGISIGTTSPSSSSSVRILLTHPSGSFIGFGFGTTGGGAIGSPDTNRLHFYTASGTLGSEVYVERGRFSNLGNFIINNTTTDNGQRLQVTGDTLVSDSLRVNGVISQGIAPEATVNFYMIRPMSSGVSPTAFAASSTINSNATTSATYFLSQAQTQAASFTVGAIEHFKATRLTIGAGSAITNQYGFFADSTLIGATNNFGFYGNIASGTGRWNLYMNGTAANYLAGSLGIGTTGLSNTNLNITKNLTGSTNTYGIYNSGSIRSDVTTGASMFTSNPSIQNAVFTLSALRHFQVDGISSVGSATIATQFGFMVESTMTGATTNYGFYGNIAAATGRWNIFMDGTANNFMRGSLLVGTSTTSTGEALQVNGTMKVTGASTFARITAVTSGINLDFNSGILYHFGGSGDYYQLISGANYLLLNRTATGNLQLGTQGIPRFTIASDGAATFSSSVMAVSLGVNVSTIRTRSEISAILAAPTALNTNVSAGNLLLSDGGNIGLVMGLYNTSFDSYIQARNNLGANNTAYSLLLNPLGGNVGINRTSASYALDVTGEARVSSAIAIGTTPDTNKPFKILKNINATVGINFENTSTSSLAFSAIQMGTDVTGGTKFTNLVYGSSGITQNGVYHPDGTSLINNGGGGLNFLGTPTRFYTGGSNGVVRLYLDNNGLTQLTATTPTTNETDGYRQYSADVVAGNAAPHFRTENGAVIKIYQETTGVGNAIFSAGGGTGVLDDSTFDGYTLRQIVKALRNQGILA